jgi:hypothetical protein
MTSIPWNAQSLYVHAQLHLGNKEGAMQVQIENPLCRVPVSLLMDDSCPVINLGHFWIKGHDGRPTNDMPVEIPVSFAREFGEWCAESRVKGKFSFIPMPAGLGTIDLGIPGFPKAHLEEWMRAAEEFIWPSFDANPEMLTHCQVVDLSDWTMTDQWENGAGVRQRLPAEWMAEYITAALRILRNVDIAAEGVSSPGAFGLADLDALAAGTIWAEKDVNGTAATYFFCEGEEEGLPWPKLYHVDAERGEGCVGILCCTEDYFGSWEGNNREILRGPDYWITEDLQGGRLPEVVAGDCPVLMDAHWPGFYFQGEEVGFTTFKAVVSRINRLPNVLWMKTSEIADYWLAREMVRLEPTAEGCRISSPIACRGFTLRLSPARRSEWQLDGTPLRQVKDALSLESGTWAADGEDIVVASDLAAGETELIRAN